jgi:hypothetical protein
MVTGSKWLLLMSAGRKPLKPPRLCVLQSVIANLKSRLESPVDLLKGSMSQRQYILNGSSPPV